MRGSREVLPGSRGTGSSVMTVGDIERGDRIERLDEELLILTSDVPEGVPHPVGRLELEQGRSRGRSTDDGFDHSGRAKG